MLKKRIEFTDFPIDQNESSLKCPNCGSNYLQHSMVHVFNRREDSKTGQHFKIIGESVVLDDEMLGNPSNRREGLMIHFNCEGCDAAIFMSISQEKGRTQIWMDWHKR